MPAPEMNDDAAAFFAVAILGPYFFGAVIYLSYAVYSHKYNRPVYPKVNATCDVSS